MIKRAAKQCMDVQVNNHGPTKQTLDDMWGGDSNKRAQ